MEPNALKAAISTGLLSFPVTDFDAEGSFEPNGYRRRLEWLMPYGATALFAAGGTGEFFSLAPDEYSDVIRSEEHTSELQSIMRISYDVFCLNKKKKPIIYKNAVANP